MNTTDDADGREEQGTPLPAQRDDLVVRPLGDDGQHVVKDTASGEYFHLGQEEAFLLMQLDGRQPGDCIRAAYASRFGRPLTADELAEFVALADAQGFLQRPGAEPIAIRPTSRARQSLFHWRMSLCDPDRLLTWLAPKLWFVWTRWFVALSLASILFAVAVVATNATRLTNDVAAAVSWRTAVLVWLVLWGVTALHELAHALACKHYGGQVREIGFLLLFFTPCLYANVSDAWLFRDKSQRIVVTLAGVWCELSLWSLAVFAWCWTAPLGLAHDLALAVATACGLGTLLNLNPLLKLDGYYLLSDWLEIPNLRQRAWAVLRAEAGWRLLGRLRPAREERHRFLLVYALASALFIVAFLSATVVGVVLLVAS